jgi:transposase, IS5 family
VGVVLEGLRGFRCLNLQHSLPFSTMRHHFHTEPDLQITPIEQMRLPLKSRDELPPILAGLRWIGMQPTLQREIFSLREARILEGKQAPGRTGLGPRLLLVTDPQPLIQDDAVLQGEAEVDQSLPVADRLLGRSGAGSVASRSFDKGFTRAEDRELLSLSIPEVVMPKRGKKNAAETERERGKKFMALRRHHSAVESASNSLEHHGLNRCLDVGLEGYRRYVGDGVMSYNLHVIGRELLRRERERGQSLALAELLHGAETQGHADAGYTGVEKRPEIKALARTIDWPIARTRGVHKARAEGAEKEARKAVEKGKASGRAFVEHPFHIVKNLFRHRKVRDRGLVKNGHQLYTLFGLANVVSGARGATA